MKFHLKNFTLKHYLRHVRRQSKHIQHIHAIVFAGAITSAIAGVILYSDYGFWHETYRAEPEIPLVVSTEPVSLGKSFGTFLGEAKEKFNSIGSSTAGFLEGKETYTKDSD